MPPRSQDSLRSLELSAMLLGHYDVLRMHIIRPPDILVGGLTGFIAILLSFFNSFFLSFFLSFFYFFRHPPSELAERKSTTTGHMLESEWDLKTHVRNLGYPLPLQICPKTTFFRQLRNLAATLTGYIFRKKHDIENLVNALQITLGLIHRPKYELWSTNGLKLDLHFYPPFITSAFHTNHCQASQMETSKRNST